MSTPSFLTLAPDAPLPIAVWSDDLRVIAYHTEASLPDSLTGLPRWRFTVETTLSPGSGVNGANHPVVDADGRPLWAGCRILVRWGKAWNSQTDTGRYQGTERHTTSALLMDHEHARTDARGFCQPASRTVTYCTTSYHRDGLLPGSTWLYGEVGSRYELGLAEHFVRVTDDPREVCLRVRLRRSKPAARAA